MKLSILRKLFFILILNIYIIFSPNIIFAESVANIEIDPELDISTFPPYKIKAQVSGSPTSVTTQIQLLNADGTKNWDYYANGIPYSTIVEKIMTYDVVEDKYVSENIYPDSIYPEIFFVPSDVTRNNLALETDIYRGNYHLFHFDNPLEIIDDSSFFIEFNAKPYSLESSVDLDVYLIKKDIPISFFNSSWMRSPDVELVGTFSRKGSFHHTHSEENNSQHNLISLTSNNDGTLGLKNIDVNDDFWIVLYSDATSIKQGWNLRYQPESFCSDITKKWYNGNKTVIIQGTRPREIFSTSLNNSGCPDVHVHIARRGLDFYDSISPTVIATYADNSTASLSSSIPFAELPNLAPNPTSFITPISGNVYDGNELAISWNPTTDPNNDNINYTIYVNDGSITTTLVASTTANTFNWDISSIADGTYNISGEVCDDNPTPLCTNFELSSSFVIERILPTYILDNIEIYSNNNFSISSAAKANDLISLEFDTTGDISETLSVDFFSGGNEITSDVSYSNNGNSWIASYIVNHNDTDGSVSYVISADNLDSQYSYDSEIIIDNTPPLDVTSSPVAGVYNRTTEVTLNSYGSDIIKYSFNDDLVDCSSGEEYINPIILKGPKTIKTISCDNTGNISNLISFEYVINSNKSAGYTLDGRIRNLLNMGKKIEAEELAKKFPNQIIVKAENADEAKFIFLNNLRLGINHTDIKELQKFLNDNGYLLVTTGPGSKGFETNYFGKLTKQAVIKFQLANKLKGDGIVGPLTRVALNK